MAVLDLQALTDETINELGLDSNSLWLVKINKKVFGPFETGALKLHSGKFPEQFDDSQVSPMMSPHWQPFFSVPQFQRRTMEVLGHTDWDKAHYYALIDGVKAGPYSMADIEALCTNKEIILTDLISWDEGHQWTKLYLHPHFDRRHRESVGLPALPVESSFLKSEAEMTERWESGEERPVLSASLASLAYISHRDHKTKLNIEEIPYHAPKTDEEVFQMEKRKKVGFSAAAIVMMGAFSSWLLLSDNNRNSPDLAALEADLQVNNEVLKNSEADPNSWSANRSPASVSRPAAQVPRPRQQVIEPTSNYAPEVYHESHTNYQEPTIPEPYGEVEAPSMPEEHSLVQGSMPGEPSLDSAFEPINDESIPEPLPVVEEVSDF
ncbi:MAG: hypothetical protein ACOVP4_07720 [Bacteriovoracaceae bacterium]